MRPTTILNVNDHAANLYLVSKILRGVGFEVIEARTAAEAVALARDPVHRPALIVLDVRLPDRSGFEVCRELKADPATREIKILHTSATHVTSGDRIEGLDAGADGYLTQPFEPPDLVATVRSLIRLREVEADLHERNDRLVDADRRKDEFLAMLAHELRNPLAAIQMGLPLLERSPRDAIESQALAVMRRQTALLSQLVDDLLDVSRVTRGRIDLALETIDLGALVASCCDDMEKRVLAPRQQKLVCRRPPEAIHVVADGGRIEQILVNLLDNASKYSDADTTIEVELARAGDQAELRVRDQGIGIDVAALSRMFELFMQAPTSLARSRGGLGIGLTLVKALVEMHGGTIAARSEGLGHGTELIVRLPVVEAPAVAVVPAVTTEPAPEPRYRILLVDDNEDARDLMRTLLELRGHTVGVAGDGPSGVDRAREVEPHIAFIDIGLPGIDGYEVARRIRGATTERERPTLIALSGYGTDDAKRRSAEAGFDQHLVKPVKMAQILRLLAEGVSSRRTP